jgi:hypothetical protein
VAVRKRALQSSFPYVLAPMTRLLLAHTTNTYRGTAFQLDTRYGEHLNVIFVAMLLSGGLPIAYLAAAAWFGVAYWSEKWELLKLSRRPVAYGGSLSEAVTNIVPFATVHGRDRLPQGGATPGSDCASLSRQAVSKKRVYCCSD